MSFDVIHTLFIHFNVILIYVTILHSYSQILSCRSWGKHWNWFLHQSKLNVQTRLMGSRPITAVWDGGNKSYYLEVFAMSFTHTHQFNSRMLLKEIHPQGFQQCKLPGNFCREIETLQLMTSFSQVYLPILAECLSINLANVRSYSKTKTAY